jgi:hypothetical protein
MDSYLQVSISEQARVKASNNYTSVYNYCSVQCEADKISVLEKATAVLPMRE